MRPIHARYSRNGIRNSVLRILEWGPTNPSAGLGQLTQQELEVAFVKRNIAVQTDDRFVGHILHAGIAGVECQNFPGEVRSFRSGMRSTQSRKLGRIPLYDLVGPVVEPSLTMTISRAGTVCATTDAASAR